MQIAYMIFFFFLAFSRRIICILRHYSFKGNCKIVHDNFEKRFDDIYRNHVWRSNAKKGIISYACCGWLAGVVINSCNHNRCERHNHFQSVFNTGNAMHIISSIFFRTKDAEMRSNRYNEYPKSMMVFDYMFEQ